MSFKQKALLLYYLVLNSKKIRIWQVVDFKIDGCILPSYIAVVFHNPPSFLFLLPRVPQCLTPRTNWDHLMHPLSPKRVFLPHRNQRGGHTHLRVREWGVPIRTTEKAYARCLLFKFHRDNAICKYYFLFLDRSQYCMNFHRKTLLSNSNQQQQNTTNSSHERTFF